jgi:hypothetical protein
MLVLAMAPGLCDLEPSVLEKQPDHVSYLHDKDTLQTRVCPRILRRSSLDKSGAADATSAKPGRHRQACGLPHVAPLVCYPSTGVGPRHPHHPGTARSQGGSYHPGTSSCGTRRTPDSIDAADTWAEFKPPVFATAVPSSRSFTGLACGSYRLCRAPRTDRDPQRTSWPPIGPSALTSYLAYAKIKIRGPGREPETALAAVMGRAEVHGR